MKTDVSVLATFSLFLSIANWRVVMLLTVSEQDSALPQGRTFNDVVRSTASNRRWKERFVCYRLCEKDCGTFEIFRFKMEILCTFQH